MSKNYSSRKLLTPILLFGFLIFAAFVLHISVSTYRKEHQHIETYTESMVRNLILGLDVNIAAIESVLVAQSHCWDIEQKDSLEFYEKMEGFLRDNKFVYDAGLDFWDPILDDDGDACSKTFYVSRDSVKNNELVRGYKIVPNSIVSNTELDCYLEALESDHPCWSQPYYDGLFTHEYMVTCYQDSDTRGVMLSIDVMVERLLESIDDMQFYRNSKMYIATVSGEVFSLDNTADNGLRIEKSDFNSFDDKDYIKISAHYDKLDLDIINLIPKDEISNPLKTRTMIALLVFIVALSLLAVLVHRSFRKAQEELAQSIKLADQEEIALRSIEKEVSIASSIHMGMLASPGLGVHLVPDEGACADVMAHIIPAREVGGDLYEYRMKGHNLVMCIADVSGKGIPASVIMTKCCTLFHAYVSNRENPDPSDMLRYMNRQMCYNNDEVMFVTMWVGVLDMRSGSLKYASAGHNAPVLIHDGGASFLEKHQGMPLGMFDDAEFKTLTSHIEMGDSLLLYTDGITEAEGPGKVLYGDERLLDTCRNLPSCNPVFVSNKVLDSVRNHAKGCVQSDDITLLCVTYGGKYAQLHSIDEVPSVHTLSDECGGDYRTALALEEMAVNAFRHGGASFVGVEYTDGTYVMIQNGDEFNPVSYVAPEQEDGELQIGGRGISLVRSISSDFAYSRIDNAYNRIMMKI